MQEQLISYQVAKLAKEKGFNISGENIYENKELLCEVEFKNWNNGTLCLLAPTQSLLQKWLREIHNIFITVNINLYCAIFHNNDFYMVTDEYNSYEEALEFGLFEALKLIENE